MAKHVAYPLIIASIFFKVTANSAEALEKNGAIFNKGTLLNKNSQELSSSYNNHSMDMDDAAKILISFKEITASKTLGEDQAYFSDSSPDIIDSSNDEFSRPVARQLFSEDVAGDEQEQISQPRSVNGQAAREQHYEKWLKRLKAHPPKGQVQHTQAFFDSLVEGVYHSPVKTGSNFYHFPKGVSPTKTPRGRNNRARLKKGLSPLLWDKVNNIVIPCEMHHVGQKNDGSHIVMVPKILHKKNHALFHTRKKKSRINRSEFNSEKKRVFKALGKKFWEGK
ncbi:HNH/ENDO VII family nuclease [Candidatus Odyssella acanthamoebae]|nr:HNH/ENDO VII family nuclease [Candidatus Paracaedibacter acanthamoebae]